MIPQFKIVKEIPKELNPRAIERAVEQFVEECGLEVDKLGFFNQTIETIANSSFGATNNASQFWLAHEDGEVSAYAICSVTKDHDSGLTYNIQQSWVAPKYRRDPAVKQWFAQLRAEGKRLMCKTATGFINRNIKAYLRWLGKEWKPSYLVIKSNL